MTAPHRPDGGPAAPRATGVARPQVARLYDSVRTAHLERFARMAPATVIYRQRRYDFEDDGTIASLHRLGRWATVAHLLRTPYRAVEVSEPLMTGRWVDLALQLAALRARAALTRRPVVIGAYCIGLTDPVEKLHARHRIPRRLLRPVARLVLGTLVRGTDRLAFGTTASYELLARHVDPVTLAARSASFPAVAARCWCYDGADPVPGRVAFVGAFSDRKGIGRLLAAWAALPPGHGMTLHVIGTGAQRNEVETWATGRPEVRLQVDPPRADVHAALRAAQVLVLLSQPVGYWREQVGLPLVEGLAHGCEIVTTDQTGLAGWLGEHGHTVLPWDSAPASVAAALQAASASARPPDAVLADLPEQDPRLAADRWLLAPSPPRGRRHADAGSARSYLASARRSARRYGVHPTGALRRRDDRPVFVVGSPRSGTSFVAGAIGAVPGFADLGELRPLKRVIPALVAAPTDVAAVNIRRIVARAQRLGMLATRRCVEQTPESSFLITAIARAFPQARFVHMVRDGRDVAASLLRLGWVSSEPEERADEVGQSFGAHARFWVEDGRRAEFDRAGDATRAAWVWRRYETTTRALLAASGAATIEIRYEELVSRPQRTAEALADGLGETDRHAEFAAAFRDTTSAASGRWRRDLSPPQLAEVTAEAGALLAELGYVDGDRG